MVVSMIGGIQPHLTTLRSINNGSAVPISDKGIVVANSDEGRLGPSSVSWGNAEQANASANAMATIIRSMDSQVQALTHHLQHMNSDIRSFRKDFPPFPRGSEERERLLNTYQGIRKQIERLTIPPPEKNDISIFPDTSSEPVEPKHALVEGFKQILQTVHAHLPDIPKETSDMAFMALQEELESLLAFISRKRAEFGEMLVPRKFYGEDMNQDATFQMTAFSIHVGQALSDETEWQITVSQKQLLQALKE